MCEICLTYSNAKKALHYANNKLLEERMKVLDELYYSETHEWVKIDNDTAYVGISDYAQKELGEIVYVDLPEEDRAISGGEVLGSIEAAKAVVDFISPISGTIIKVNEELADNPVLINESPYGEGWLIKLKISDPSEIEALLIAQDYRKLVSE